VFRVFRGYLVQRLTILFMLACATPASAGEPPRWQPEKTWVVIVGVLEWRQNGLYKSFPKEGRRDAQLAKLFRDKGVPARQVAVLEDQEATREKIQHTLDKVLSATNAGDFLIVYYAGHGVRFQGTTYLTNYDITADTGHTGLSVIAIVDAIERRFRGSQVLLTADCCNSGAFGVEAGKRQSRISYATLTSSQSIETSTGHWTFTDCLLAGLQGDPAVDQNADGSVTLEELAKYTESEMAFAEEQLASFSTSSGFDPKLTLASVEKSKEPRGGRRVEAEWKGRWWPAHVLAEADGKAKVRYAGFGQEWDEWVEPARLRPHNPRIYARGTSVHVLWKDEWWEATVKESSSGLHFIRYTGFGAEWDEWVGSKRIRP
jgi:hypothetical protein